MLTWHLSRAQLPCLRLSLPTHLVLTTPLPGLTKVTIKSTSSWAAPMPAVPTVILCPLTCQKVTRQALSTHGSVFSQSTQLKHFFEGVDKLTLTY